MAASCFSGHLAQNQPKFDGNKRTSLVAALAFLHANGFCSIVPREALCRPMIAIAQRRMTKAGRSHTFRNPLSPTP